MLSHTFLGITDFPRAFGFHSALMDDLGWALRFSDADKAIAAWAPSDAPRPLFVIGRPYDREPASPGNGPMVALLAPSRAAVNSCYALAMAKGAKDEGAPGLRPHYHPNFYGAYFRDPDGNKLAVCHHDPL